MADTIPLQFAQSLLRQAPMGEDELREEGTSLQQLKRRLTISRQMQQRLR